MKVQIVIEAEVNNCYRGKAQELLDHIEEALGDHLYFHHEGLTNIKVRYKAAKKRLKDKAETMGEAGEMV